MSRQEIRFTVIANNLRSGTWKCWARADGVKSDVYLQCRELGAALKTSFHQSGSWHTGFLAEYLQDHREEYSEGIHRKYLEIYSRPTEISPGLTVAHRVVVPSGSISSVLGNDLPPTIVKIPSPPDGKAVEVTFLYSSAKWAGSRWPGHESMGTQLVGVLNLANGEKLWLVHHVIDSPNLGPSKSTTHKFKAWKDTDWSTPGKRGFVAVDFPDGSKGFIEFKVQEKESA